MSKKKAEWATVSQFICNKLEEDIKKGYFHPAHIKIIIEEIYPYSWKRYCDIKGLNYKLRKVQDGKEVKA